MKRNIYSIIDNAIPVSNVDYVLSIAHDANSKEQDYYNAVIILEKISQEQHVVQLFEPKIVEIEQKIQLTVNTQTPELSIEAFKQRIAGKDYYAFSFSAPIAQVDSLIKELSKGLEKPKEYFSRKSPSFFSSGMLGHPDETTTFQWTRELMLDAITSDTRKVYIAENIGAFKAESTHIGDLSPKRCLVM